MSVQYKFKAQKDYHTVEFQGVAIKVLDLKRAIFERQKGGTAQFNLLLTDAQTGQEFDNDQNLVPRNTCIEVRRVPLRPNQPLPEFLRTPLPSQTAASGPGSTAASAPAGPAASSVAKAEPYSFGGLTLPAYGATLSTAPEDEVAKLEAHATENAPRMMMGRGRGRGTFQNRVPRAPAGPAGPANANMTSTFKTWQGNPPPPGYICHRCKKDGHYIQQCPTNGDPRFDTVRPTKTNGIPKVMLRQVADSNRLNLEQGSMLFRTADGSLQMMAPNRREFEKALAGGEHLALHALTDPYEVLDFPAHLKCSICSRLMKEAVHFPCCSTAACDGCARRELLEKQFVCPGCGHSNTSPDSLHVAKDLRTQVETVCRQYTEAVTAPRQLQTASDSASASPTGDNEYAPGHAPIGDVRPSLLRHDSMESEDNTMHSTDAAEDEFADDLFAAGGTSGSPPAQEPGTPTAGDKTITNSNSVAMKNENSNGTDAVVSVKDESTMHEAGEEVSEDGVPAADAGSAGPGGNHVPPGWPAVFPRGMPPMGWPYPPMPFARGMPFPGFPPHPFMRGYPPMDSRSRRKRSTSRSRSPVRSNRRRSTSPPVESSAPTDRPASSHKVEADGTERSDRDVSERDAAERSDRAVVAERSVERVERDTAERADRDRSERDRSDRDRSDRERSDRDRSDRDRSDRERSDRDRSDRDRSDRDRSDRDRSDRDRSDRDRSDRDRSDRDRSDRDRSDRDRSDRDRYDRERYDRERYDRERADRDRERYERDRHERERYDRDHHAAPVAALSMPMPGMPGAPGPVARGPYHPPHGGPPAGWMPPGAGMVAMGRLPGAPPMHGMPPGPMGPPPGWHPGHPVPHMPMGQLPPRAWAGGPPPQPAGWGPR